MLTSNHNRRGANSTGNVRDTNEESTKYAGSGRGADIEDKTINSEIESKYTKKIIKMNLQKKFYKEDDDEDDMLRDADKELLKRKDDVKVLPEVVTKKKPRDPFKDLDPLN